MSEVKYIVTVKPKFEINHSRINIMTGQTSIGFVGSYPTLEEANEKMAELKSKLIDAMKIDKELVHELDNGSKLAYVNQIDRSVGCYWIKPNEEEIYREPYGGNIDMKMEVTASKDQTSYCGTIDAEIFKNEVYEADDPMIVGKMVCKSISAKTGVKMEYLSVGLYDEDKHTILIHNNDDKQEYPTYWSVNITEVEPEDTEEDEDEDDSDDGPYALFIRLNDKSSYNADNLFNFLADQEFILREIPVNDANEHCRVVKIDDDFQTYSWDAIVKMYQNLYGALMCAFQECKPITKSFTDNDTTGVEFLATVSKKAIGCSIWISSAGDEDEE